MLDLVQTRTEKFSWRGTGQLIFAVLLLKRNPSKRFRKIIPSHYMLVFPLWLHRNDLVIYSGGMMISVVIAIFEFIWKQRKLAVDENVSITLQFQQVISEYLSMRIQMNKIIEENGNSYR